ncbi:MAG TPA: oxidoreductase [Ideonella sp.]|nr:oxidoreductase [Ideonella sp.]
MTTSAKTWLITGCSSGLGAAIAEAALAHGDQVMLTARDPNTLRPIAARWTAGQARVARLDVTDPATAAQAISETEAAFGRLDVLVNNAGFGVIGAVEEVSPTEYRRMFETNVFGLIETTRAALPALRRSRGRIVNLSSGSGVASRAGFGLYSASKFAVEGLSEALAQEVAPLGIRIILVEPGAFRTEFLGRSMLLAEQRLPIYEDTASKLREYSSSMSGKQPGDPVRGAAVVFDAVHAQEPPLRLPLGPDAHRLIRAKLASVAADLDAWSERTQGTNFVEPAPSAA